MTGAWSNTSPRRALIAITKSQSPPRIVYFGVSVKSWANAPPSVDAVRPARCGCCGQPGAPAGAPKGLHGHGLRERWQLGPLACGERAEAHSLMLRRYQCQRCGAVVVACPRGVLPRLRYGAVAVALALCLWAVEGQPGHQVRAAVSPLESAGNERFHGWRSLGRWARGSPSLWPKMRARASDCARDAAFEAVRQLAARAAEPTGPLLVDACAGALCS